MKLIDPIVIDDDSIVATNVTVSETAWTAGSYSKGAQRYIGTDLYEVVADTTTASPLTGIHPSTRPAPPPEPGEPAGEDIYVPPSWIRLGKINKHRAFDDSVGTQTTRGGTIEYTFKTDEVVNGFAALNLVGSSLTVTIDDPAEGRIFTRVYGLQDNSDITSWWAYFFEPIREKPDIVELNLPPYPGALITVVIDAGGETAKAGSIILGQLKTLGHARFGARVSILDFSEKERDTFGNFTVLERAFAKIADFPIYLLTRDVDGTQRTLAGVRAKPVVYIGDPARPETIVYGFYRGFQLTLSGPIASEGTIEIEGLV